MIKSFFLIALVFFILNTVTAQIQYPGKQQPADTVCLFAEGILSDGLSNRDFTISPKGDEIFFTIQHPAFASSTILRMVKKNGAWTSPEVASFSGRYRDLEAAFSGDGQTIYFSSDRPIHGDTINSFDIWKTKRNSNGSWGNPENLGSNVNSSKNEFYPSVTRNGDLYFTANIASGKGNEDIVVCRLTDTGYSKPESLPAAINSNKGEFNAFIDPDEKFIIFSSFGRTDDTGGGDLYISHKDAAGNWAPAMHLPTPVNSTGLDYCPFVSWDKQLLIFTSNRTAKPFEDKSVKTYSTLKKLLSSPGNGNDDIYWIKFNPDWIR